MSKHQSRTEILRNIPEDLRIEIIENEFRKDFTESEKHRIAEILKPHLQKHRHQGKRTDLGQTTSHSKPVAKDRPESVNEKIGKILNESGETVRKRDRVFRTIDEDTKKALDSGEKSLNALHTKITIKENREKPAPELPKGKFTDILTDNGWDFGNKNIGGSGKSGAGYKYRTEPANIIARIPIASIAAENAVLYQWTTNQHLITGSMPMSEYYEILNEQKLETKCKKITNQDKIKKLQEQTKSDNESLSEILKGRKVQSDALAVMHCHGFTPKCIVTWEKEEKEGWSGYWMDNVTEHLIIGIRGNVPAFGLSEKTIIKSKYVPGSHSKKPETAWQLIEKCANVVKGKHRKLEMNCRTPRKGWHPHGDAITAKDLKEWQKLK